MTRETPNRFLLVYSSQTGQAKAIAEEVAEKSTQYGLHADIHCISQTEKKFWLEREKCLVLITSTTGDGEPPDTAAKFWRRLRKKTLPSDYLKELHFALLGLGDSNYTNFCLCGKMLDKRLDDLGAQRFMPSAFADDGPGLEIVVEPWMDDLFPALRAHLGLPPIELENSQAANNIPIMNGNCDQEKPESQVSVSETPLVNGVDGSVHAAEHDEKSCVASTNLLENGDKLESSNTDKVSQELAKITVDDSRTPVSSEDSKSSNVESNLTVTQDSNQKLNTSDAQIIPNSSINTQGQQIETNTSIKTNDDSIQQEVESLVLSLPPLCESSLNLPARTPDFIQVAYKPDLDVAVSSLPVQNEYPFPSAKTGVCDVPLVTSQVLTTPDAVKKALKITLDISSTGWQYLPGDAFGFVCPNQPEEVQKLLDRLGLSAQADTVCELSVIEGTKKRNASIPAYLQPQATLRHWFTTCLDIRAAPKKALLRALVDYTSDPHHQRRLQELCARQGAAHYSLHVRGACLGIWDLLNAFPSIHPPVSVLLEHLPRLLPRPYSAASCQDVREGLVDFVYNLTELPAKSQHSTHKRGVCTGWLEGLTRSIQKETGAQDDSEVPSLQTLSIQDIAIPVFLRSNQHFRPPTDLSVPLIMVGPGTGVAPFIGFLQHREHLLKQKPEDAPVAECWLFYGCRHQDRDFLFRRELEGFSQSGVLTQLHVCFSRDSPEGSSSPRYVQDNIGLHGEAVSALLARNDSQVYVCGDAGNMAKDVRQKFVQVLQEHQGMPLKDAESCIIDLVLNKRYHEDVWT